MHDEILSDNQKMLLPLLKKFSNNYGLVGGTAIALHLGHRHSIDFDLFSYSAIDHQKIRNTIRQKYSLQQVFVENKEELSVLVNGVKLTFYQYPFPLNYSINFNDIIKIPDLLTLASMKVFALGRRAKWKDYVDLFFIFESNHSFKEVVNKTNEIFGHEFNEKLFREQLSYFEDIDYSEQVNYLPKFIIKQEEIKQKLVDHSLI